jgi:formate/nitrite transporter FocA (FNT family)
VPQEKRDGRRSEESFSGAAELDGLSRKQVDEVERQSRPNAALIHETIRAEGESELERSASALALSALAAGLSMGFSLLVQGWLQAAIVDGPTKELIAPLGYTVGFLVVVLGRQQLFTENTLTPILPLLHNRDWKTVRGVARLWAVVLAANIAGTILFAFAVAHSGIFEPARFNAFLTIGREALNGDFASTFLRGIFAGWLIALMVWLLPGAEAARIFVILVITYVVSLGHFSHIIAGSVDAAFMVATGHAGWSDYLFRFFAPTLLGNILGGIALVAVLNYGQVAAEIEGTE